MFTWREYYVEQERRQDQLDQAKKYRFVKAHSDMREKRFTNLSIRILDVAGSQLVRWGHHLQCRCAELANSAAKRSYVS